LFFSVGRINETTSFAYAVEGGPQSPPSTVQVDSTTGACAGRVTVQGPSQVPAGSSYTVQGVAPGTNPQLVILGNRGFDQPRTLSLAPDSIGRYRVTMRATDITSYYAAAHGCASSIFGTYPLPSISGPAVVRRGDTALLHVRAVPDEFIEIYFHRAGTTGYTLGRTGRIAADGTYTTGYVATADYRYYAKIHGGLAGSPGITKVR
jgi:hypothetical protein